MIRRLLTDDHEELLATERAALGELRAALAAVDASREDQEVLGSSIEQLDELFLVVVVGEFNAGKSTLINALLGRAVLPEGVTPTTTAIHVIRHGDEEQRRRLGEAKEEIRVPAPLLEHLHIVDTPGTNALERRHEAITAEYVPRADLVLFTTSADRPFTESERSFLEGVRDWGKKLVVVVNKVDILRLDEDVQRIEAYVADAARDLVGLEPPVFPVAARLALEGKLEDDDDKQEESRLVALERYLVETLDDDERFRLKLSNPLGVGRRLLGKYRDAVEERAGLLADDFEALDETERQLALYREDLSRDLRHRLGEIDAILRETEERGTEFFEETVRIGRVFDLLRSERIRAEFEREVVADLPGRIDAAVGGVIDWLVESERRQWQGVSRRLEERRAIHAERVVGEMGTFDQDRRRLLDDVGRAAHRALDRYDGRRESRRVAETVQTAVAGTALVEAGAVGLGTAVAVLATTQLVDVTGMLAAGTLAALGLFILPSRRRKAQAEFHRAMVDLREELLDRLTEQLDREIEGSARRIAEAVAPYTRFVRAERERLDEARDRLDGVGDRLGAVAARIDELG